LAADDPIDALHPDLDFVTSVTEANRCLTFAVIRRRDDANLHVRVFVPGAGIPEDPGTGSVAGPIGVIARDHLGTDAQVTIHQGQEVGRPSTIEVDVGGDAPVVGGQVALCAEGTFTI
jgi:trans-2,3-dihydro-3-hydroxyanthranilate isomerase